jgi:hypothetical protein
MSTISRTFLVPVLVLASCGFAVLVGCQDEDDQGPLDPPATTTVFSVSADTLRLSDAAPTASVSLTCNRVGESWRVLGTPAWATVDPDSGTSGEDPMPITISTRPDTLASGRRSARLVLGDEETATVALVLDVGIRRDVVVNPDTLRFAAGTSATMLSIASTGNGGVSWSLDSEQSWLDVDPPIGFAGPGTSFNVAVTVQRGQLPPGTHQGALELESNASDSVLTIPVVLGVDPTPLVGVDTDSLRFHYFSNEQTVAVTNIGNVPLTWSASTDTDFLALDPGEGDLAVGETTALTVAVDRDLIVHGANLGSVSFSNGAEQSFVLGVRVMHYGHRFWPLSHPVAAAEHDRVQDRIVTVSTTGNLLYRIQPGTQEVDSLALDLPPQCVSIAPGGSQCVVGHDGRLSWVDLDAMTILGFLPVTTDVFDIVMGGNGWAYCFPEEDQWEDIRCLELATGSESLHIGRSVRENTRAKLHPGGLAIYGADNGLSPSDFEKYDISGGQAVYVDDSPYHGDYSIAGDLWISDDGAYIIVRSGYVFHASDDDAIDMTYAGRLAGSGTLLWVDTSSAAGRVYSLSSSSALAHTLTLHDLATLGLAGSFDLPDWPRLRPDGTVTWEATNGFYVFSRPDGDGVHMLIRTDGGGDWAVVSIDGDNLP